MHEDTIRARIRTMLETGDLPCDDTDRIWAGRGLGDFCAACADRIEPTEIEYEVELTSGQTLRLHRACHALWMQECEPLPR